MATGLIALDWGTSSLRAYRMDTRGEVLDSRHLPFGIMALPPAPDGIADASTGSAFERAFDAACGDWLRAEPRLAIVACGMVGSAQGWREAAYLDLPCRLDGLASGLVQVVRGDATPVHIIPGLIQRGALPNVMRGEETQVAGVLASLPPALAGHDDLLIALPGTHCKWVSVRDAEVVGFTTFMTGEVYGALCSHTLLGRTMQPAAAPDEAAFARGVNVAGSGAGRMGPLSTVFSSRTLGLTGQLANTSQADYLSGLLIGHEVASMAASLGHDRRKPRIVLCGDPALCRRYAFALAAQRLETPAFATDATQRGLWQIATTAGLVRA
ncbi:MAG: 2-dehydro-3-deoxygalactonokinase [Haliea sp.]|nr:MAG: 2-dehydro-3-deoxygalactonokinase [Haliea sp.]